MATKSIILLSLSAIVSSLDHKEQFSGQHSAVAEDASLHLGCVWDGESGCHDGCDPASMEARCQRFSHDQDACEGKEGQDDWCVWSHGDNGPRSDVLEANVNGELSAHSHSASSDSLHSEGAGYGSSGGSSSGRGGKSGSGSRSGSSSRRYSKGSGSGSGSASESADHSVKPKSRTTALQARRVETNVRLVNDDDTKHHDSKDMEEDSDDDTKHHDSKDMKQDDISERLGCIWDETGCASGCDMEAMTTRCDGMSQTICESRIGKKHRCLWSHGASDAEMNVDVRFGHIGEDSTVDTLLIGAGVLTTLFIIHQLYRRFTKNSEYQKLQDTQHHDEIQITSHTV